MKNEFNDLGKKFLYLLVVDAVVALILFAIFGISGLLFGLILGVLGASVLLLMAGSDWVVSGSQIVGSILGLTQLIIGATFVSMGTTLPELATNIVSSAQNKVDFAIGNILGSYTFNTLGIVGAASFVGIVTGYIIAVPKSAVRKIPLALGSVVLLFLLCIDGVLSFLDGIALLIGFGGWIWYIYADMKAEQRAKGETDKKIVYSPEERVSKKKAARAYMLFGFVALAAGAMLLVWSSSSIARMAGLTETFIGLTIVAIGTSAPELAVSVQAAIRKDYELGIGNVIGADVLDVLMVLGISSIVKPIPFNQKAMWDIIVSFGAMSLLGIALWSMAPRLKMTWWKGLIFLVSYTTYVLYLLERDGAINIFQNWLN